MSPTGWTSPGARLRREELDACAVAGVFRVAGRVLADSCAVTADQPLSAELPGDGNDGAGGGWLTPGVIGIGMASLLADAGHEIPTALLPSLLTSTLGVPAAALGVIEGVADGLAGAARLAGGALADDPRRRREVAVGGYTATAVLSAAIAAAQTVWQVGVLRCGSWLARGLRVPARFEVGNVAATLLILRATELLTSAHGATAATSLALVLYVGYNVAATVASISARARPAR